MKIPGTEFASGNWKRQQIIQQKMMFFPIFICQNSLSIVVVNLMKKQTQCPFSGFNFGRGRLNSLSPALSPLHLVSSPQKQDANFFEVLSSVPDFRLQPAQEQNAAQYINEQDSTKYSRLPLINQNFQQLEEDFTLNQNNALSFLLKNMNKYDQCIEKAKDRLEEGGTSFMKNLFRTLMQKLLTVKKTKEQKVKYCIRKSFKYITTKMKKFNKQKYGDMEMNQTMTEFFTLYSDQTIDIPFQKNSELKTMNSAFLRKVFKCPEYIAEYKLFLREFSQDLKSDNDKRIKKMNEVIKKCIKSNNFNAMDQIKRLPWSDEIMESFTIFAKELMKHSPEENFEEEIRQMKKEPEQNYLPEYEEQGQILDFLKAKTTRKKSIMYLTPLIQPKYVALDEVDLSFALQ